MSVRVLTTTVDDLDARTAYAVWRLRQDVFVVEQDCPYPDLDGRDLEPGTRHVVLLEDDAVLGTLRVLDDGGWHASAASCWPGRPAAAAGPRC
jgi:ElaA protein